MLFTRSVCLSSATLLRHISHVFLPFHAEFLSSSGGLFFLCRSRFVFLICFGVFCLGYLCSIFIFRLAVAIDGGKKSTQGTSHGHMHLVKRSFRFLPI